MVQAIAAVLAVVGGGSAVLGAVRVIASVFTVVDALTGNKKSSVDYEAGNASPTYSFGKLQTQVSNLVPRPIVYGRVKVAGNKIWQTGENTSIIQQIICLCDGEINSISDLRLNDNPIGDLPGCSYTAYFGNGTQDIDIRVPGATQSDKAAKVGGLKYDAYLAITAQASSKISDSGFNVTCIVEGKKVRVYTTSTAYTTVYSNNPAWCILDFLTCYNGVGLSYDDIDIASFIDAANYCDYYVDGQARFALNLIIDSKQSRHDWLSAMLLVCRGYILYQEGRVYLKIDRSGSAVQTFDGSNIIAGTEKFWTTPRENKYDVVKVQFIDPDNEYARVYAVAELPVYGNEQPIVKSVEAFGITNFRQASRLAWFFLNEATTTNKFMAFTVTKAGLDRTVGDIVKVTSTSMGYSEKLFRIVEMSELQQGQIELKLKEYNANLYNDTQGSVAPTLDVISKDGNTFNTAITEITVQGGTDKDQGLVLQRLIDDLSERTGGVLNVDAAKDGVYINSCVNVKSNVHLVFKCPVILGRYGQIRIYGGFYESPDTDLPKIRQNANIGDTVIYCGAQPESLASNYSVGDKIVIRGMSDGNGQAIELQECTVAGVDTGANTITVIEPLEYAFKVSYPAGDYEENFGKTDYTFITFQTFASLAASAARGDAEITVGAATGFAVGDCVFFGDRKVPADIAGTSNNTYRHEVNRILAIDGTTITLENALCHDYETSYGAYIIKMDAVHNASIRGARVNYSAEPYAAVTNAFVIAYAKDCWIQDCVVENEGTYKSKGHGFRIDRAINCHTYNCAVYPPGHVGAAEGYGFSFYRCNHCSHNNAYARGCRHSFLAFRGASFNRFNDVISVDCRKSDIDFHGGDEYGNVVDGFIIQGGDASQVVGTHIEAIKFGNESHVAGCSNNVVRNGTVVDFKGFGIAFVPVSSGNVVENVTFRNINRFIRCVDLAVDGTLQARDNVVRSCVVDTVVTDLGNINGTVNGGSSQVVNGLVIENCTFKGLATYFKTFINTINCRIVGNRFLDGLVNSTNPWFIDAVNADNLLVQDNEIHGGNKFISIENCGDFVCLNNLLVDFYDTVVLDDVSGNDGYIFKRNEFEGFEETYDASGGGSASVVNFKQNHIYTEKILSDLVTTAGMSITNKIPFDTTTPRNDEGRAILSCVYQPKNAKARIKIEAVAPAVYIPTGSPQPPATNAVMALFKDGSCVGATGIRLPNTGESSGHFMQITTEIDISSLAAFALELRLGPKTSSSGETLKLGDRFNGFGIPYLVITEVGYSDVSNYLYQEDLGGYLLTQDNYRLIKE